MFTLNFPILVNTYCGNYHAANERLKELVVLAEEKGAPFRKAEGVLRRGYILTPPRTPKAAGDVPPGIFFWGGGGGGEILTGDRVFFWKGRAQSPPAWCC